MLGGDATLEETVQWALEYEGGGGFGCGKGEEEEEEKVEPEPGSETESEKESEPESDHGGDVVEAKPEPVEETQEVDEGDGIDWDALANLIPFMHPKKKPLTWRLLSGQLCLKLLLFSQAMD